MVFLMFLRLLTDVSYTNIDNSKTPNDQVFPLWDTSAVLVFVHITVIEPNTYRSPVRTPNLQTAESEPNGVHFCPSAIRNIARPSSIVIYGYLPHTRHDLAPY